MAKQRYVNTKFWSDSWVSDLDPVEKLVYIYLLTNERTNIAGIYELPVKYISSETGIEKEMVIKIINRFINERKINYTNGWIIIKNFIQHQALNPKIEKGIAVIIQNEIPLEIKKEVYNLNPSIQYYEEILLPESRKKNIRNIIKDLDICENCNNTFKKDELIVHHKKPLFAGGGSEKENLSILCINCHKEEHKNIGYDSLSKASNYSNTNSNTNINTNTNSNNETSSPDVVLLIKAFENINPASKKFYSNTTQRKSCQSLLDDYGLERVLGVIENVLPKSNTMKFFPVITTPLQLVDKWATLESAIERYQSEQKNIKSKIAF